MMYTCYDCEHFGTDCEGVIPPDKFRNRVEEFCKRFVLISWRKDMFKDGGSKRLGK
jgi:hypothetical protein